jgi:hypothetical protein
MRIATAIWHAYAHLMAMREQSARIAAQDQERIAKQPQKRAAAAARARRYRARRRSTPSQAEAPAKPIAAGEPSVKTEQ